MRLTLNLDTGALQQSPAGIELVPLVRATVGDPPFDVQLISNTILLAPFVQNGITQDSARLEFVAKPDKAGVADIAADPVVSGTTFIGDAPVNPQIVSLALGQDWHSPGLLALFAAGKNFIRLWGQFRWRPGATPLAAPWTYSLFFPIEVQNSLFPDTLIPPGASMVGAPEYYFSYIDAYIGSATSLEAITGAGLANLAIVKAVIGGVKSEWQVTKPASDPTDIDAGVIALTDGSATLRRVAGL